MQFRFIREDFKLRDLPEWQRQTKAKMDEEQSDSGKRQVLEDAIRNQIQKTSRVSDIENLVDFWTNTILVDGWDGKFTNFAQKISDSDNVILKHYDKIAYLWMLYDEGNLQLGNGIIPEEDVLTQSTLYKLSDDDFQYVVNAEEIVNHKNKVDQYLKQTPTPSEVREIFFRDGKSGYSNNSKDQIYNAIEELSRKYERKDLTGNLFNAILKDKKIGADVSDERIMSKMEDWLQEYVQLYILGRKDNAYKSASGVGQNRYNEEIQKMAKENNGFYRILNAKIGSNITPETIGETITKWIDENRLGIKNKG